MTLIYCITEYIVQTLQTPSDNKATKPQETNRLAMVVAALRWFCWHCLPKFPWDHNRNFGMFAVSVEWPQKLTWPVLEKCHNSDWPYFRSMLLLPLPQGELVRNHSEDKKCKIQMASEQKYLHNTKEGKSCVPQTQPIILLGVSSDLGCKANHSTKNYTRHLKGCHDPRVPILGVKLLDWYPKWICV